MSLNIHYGKKVLIYTHPSCLEYEDVFMALMIQRLKREGLDPQKYLNKMTRAHFNRGAIALFARIHKISDLAHIIKQEREMQT